MSDAEQLSNNTQQLSLHSNSEKPTQVVTPAIKQQNTPIKHSLNLSKSSHPSPAAIALDRLLTLGGVPISPPPPSRDMDPQIIDQLRALKEMINAQEEELEKVRDHNRQLQERLEESESTTEKLKEQVNEFGDKEKTLTQRVTEATRNHRQMSVVMEEYERTISSMIGEREAEHARWAEEKETLIRDRDHAATHLSSMELSFNDVHAKYERCKEVIQGYKINEEALKRQVVEKEEIIAKLEARYETLRRHAMLQLNKANQELDQTKKSFESETVKLNAMLKRSEVHAASLQESLQQKIKDNEELSAICDELIHKVS